MCILVITLIFAFCTTSEHYNNGPTITSSLRVLATKKSSNSRTKQRILHRNGLVVKITQPATPCKKLLHNESDFLKEHYQGVTSSTSGATLPKYTLLFVSKSSLQFIGV